MKIVKQSCAWEQKPSADALQIIERAGRTCYKSEDKITPGSAATFVRNLLKRGHMSVIEHVWASMRFISDRGFSHELVRMRLASYSQESTRYCSYGNTDGGCTFVLPVRFYPFWIDGPVHDDREGFQYADRVTEAGRSVWWRQLARWRDGMKLAENYYLDALHDDATPQEARDFLPNSLKTEIVMSANLREWLHVFTLRTASAAHPQMRSLMLDALAMFNAAVPVLFEELAAMYLVRPSEL